MFSTIHSRFLGSLPSKNKANCLIYNIKKMGRIWPPTTYFKDNWQLAPNNTDSMGSKMVPKALGARSRKMLGKIMDSVCLAYLEEANTTSWGQLMEIKRQPMDQSSSTTLKSITKEKSWDLQTKSHRSTIHNGYRMLIISEWCKTKVCCLAISSLAHKARIQCRWPRIQRLVFLTSQRCNLTKPWIGSLKMLTRRSRSSNGFKWNMLSKSLNKLRTSHS